MDEMQPDEKLVLTGGQLSYGMLVEDLVVEVFAHNQIPMVDGASPAPAYFER